jgi:hypothetical protein
MRYGRWMKKGVVMKHAGWREEVGVVCWEVLVDERDRRRVVLYDGCTHWSYRNGLSLRLETFVQRRRRQGVGERFVWRWKIEMKGGELLTVPALPRKRFRMVSRVTYYSAVAPDSSSSFPFPEMLLHQSF